MAEHHTDRFLLHTKLTIPSVRSELVARPQLFHTLQAVLKNPLTLVAAPAGFGKTTLLSSWLHKSGVPVGWVSLESGDNDPAEFWTYVITAFDKLHQGIGDIPLSLLQQAQSAPIENIVTALINALSHIQGESIVVLDDYHVIETAAIHKAVSFLLDHLPSQVHLIVASRVDPPLPLSRLRARNQLAELRIDDLRFTMHETTTFLHNVMHVQLRENDIIALEARTEGWIAGLQLAALAMKSRDDVSDFVASFAGSHRYIVDYLTEEVLQQQSEEVRMFLLQTSLLERLSGSLCNAVTEQTNGIAMLEQLERADLFLIALDEERSWYRYHHLFADTLRYRLRREQADLVPKLHERASQWFEHNDFPLDAVNHALLAQDFSRAATLIEPMINPLIERGAHATVKHWLDTLPEETLFTRPSLCMLFAWAFLFVGDVVSYNRPLDVAERAWRAENNTSRLGEVYYFRASAALVRDDAQRTLEYVRLALPLLAEDDVYGRGTCGVYLGGSYFMFGDVVEAHTQLKNALALCRASGSLYSTLYAMNFIAEVEVLEGQLRAASETSEEVIQTGGEHPNIHTSWAYSRLGSISFQRNELTLSKQHLQCAITLGEQAGQQVYMAPTYLAIAQVYWALGETEEAFSALDKAASTAQQLGNRSSDIQVKAFRARLALERGDMSAVLRWSDTVAIGTEDELSYERESDYLVMARLWMAQNTPEQAIALLSRVLTADEKAGRFGNVLPSLVLLVLAHQQAGDSVQAMTMLERAVLLAEPEDSVRVFVEEGEPIYQLLGRLLTLPSKLSTQAERENVLAYVSKLLAAFPQHYTTPETSVSGDTKLKLSTIPSPSSSLLEPLSTREQEVLELLATGISNAEIAEQLIVTVGTVKTHIKSIYGKLGVHSRMQAMIRARELGLL